MKIKVTPSYLAWSVIVLFSVFSSFKVLLNTDAELKEFKLAWLYQLFGFGFITISMIVIAVCLYMLITGEFDDCRFVIKLGETNNFKDDLNQKKNSAHEVQRHMECNCSQRRKLV